MIGRGTAYKSSGFDYRGSNELARFSRCVWQRREFVLGRIRIPLESWLMHEEVLKIRGPHGPWGRLGWDDQTEAEYQRRRLETAA